MGGEVRKKQKRRWWAFWRRTEASEAQRVIAYDRNAVEAGTTRAGERAGERVGDVVVDAARKSQDEGA